MWLDSSVTRIRARSARGPGLESLSGHELFSSPVILYKSGLQEGLT